MRNLLPVRNWRDLIFTPNQENGAGNIPFPLIPPYTPLKNPYPFIIVFFRSVTPRGRELPLLAQKRKKTLERLGFTNRGDLRGREKLRSIHPTSTSINVSLSVFPLSLAPLLFSLF